MRLDYTLYVLAALLLIITVVPLVVTIEGVGSEARSLWVVTTAVMGILSIGLGYSQRPKTKAQACEPEVPISQKTMPEAQPTKTMEAPVEKPAMKAESTVTTPAAATISLTQVKGIGEKRAMQLKALGVNSVDELAKDSAKRIAKKLKISPKTVKKWIDSAKELVK